MMPFLIVRGRQVGRTALRQIVLECYVGNEPAPAFESALNRILTKTRKTDQANFRETGYRTAVARESSIPYTTVCRYFAGENVNHFTRKRIRAAIRRLECKQ